MLSSIFASGYRRAEEIDTPASLIILNERTRSSIHGLESVTQVPFELSTKSPFLGWDVNEVARFLLENASGSHVSSEVFLIADEQTAEDRSTLLMVQNSRESFDNDNRVLRTVRVGADFINIEPVAVSVGSKSVNELLSIVDEDGVFRGGRGPPPKQGGPAPRKRLGQ